MELSSEFSIRMERSEGGAGTPDAGRAAPAETDVEAFRQALEGARSAPRQDRVPEAGREKGVDTLFSAFERASPERSASRREDVVKDAAGTAVSGEALEGARSAPRQGRVPEAGREKGVDTLFSAFERASSERSAPRRETHDSVRREETEGGIRKEEPSVRTAGGDPAVVEALFRGQEPPVTGIRTEQGVPAAGVPAEAGLDGKALEALVSRILVNPPEAGTREVRLTLGGDVLRGAEIAITRDSSGHLAVTLSARDPAVFQTLVASRGELLEGLGRSEGGTVRVEVRDESEGDEGDMRRRSRGLEERHED